MSILGMDFLSKYNFVIHYHKKKVVFKPVGEDKFKLIGDSRKARTPLISTLVTKELLKYGCTCYLASEVDISME